MLSNRPYMREDYPRERTSVLTWLISALIASFVLQVVLGSPWFNGEQLIYRFLGLTIPGLQAGRVWTLFTHPILHDSRFIFHIIVNLFALYFLGRELLPMLGPRRFLGLFAAATVIGGLAWTAVHWRFGGGDMHIGATAPVLALLILFACFFPNQELNFLLFFLFPVTLKPKHLAYGLAGLDLFGLLFYEIHGAALPFNMFTASSAHVGGMVTGFLYYRFFHDAHWFLGAEQSAEIELPRWMKRVKKPPATKPVFPANTGGSREDLRAEVDRILDKINSDGFGSLTPQEKRVLDEAKDLLSRR
ncbi:MAG: rhomboid family intramembrane serine protease [Verrucomicrobia bacterium]|nr:rhomboid family intramembrane serine protease [Verrucomicrobiota bacterium]